MIKHTRGLSLWKEITCNVVCLLGSLDFLRSSEDVDTVCFLSTLLSTLSLGLTFANFLIHTCWYNARDMDLSQLHNRNGPKEARFGYTTRVLGIPVTGQRHAILGRDHNNIYSILFFNSTLFYDDVCLDWPHHSLTPLPLQKSICTWEVDVIDSFFLPFLMK